MSTHIPALALAVVLYSIASCVHAVPITYTYTGVASGSLGGAAFSNRAFRIVMVGDTSGITPPDPSGARTNPTAATVEIAGFPAVTLTGIAFSQFTVPPVALGIRLTGPGIVLANYLYYFSPQNNLSYNLRDPFGPYTAFTLGAAGGIAPPVPTSGGLLTFVPSGQVTFVASVAQAIPLASWPLELIILTVVLWRARSRSRFT